MAFVLPVLLLLMFGIMEFGYIIFAYSTISQATRNAAEAGAQLPPYQSWLAYRTQTGLPANYPGFTGDTCVRAMYQAAQSDQTLFTNVSNFMTITYPNDTGTDDTRNLDDRGPIQVTISYPITGITPLFRLLRIGDGSGAITLQVTQRRSLENLGVDPSMANGTACARDITNYYVMRGLTP
jgi:Flp pilus assembly protein TadG